MKHSMTIVYKGVLIRELLGCGLLYSSVNKGNTGLGWAWETVWNG